MGFVKRRGLLVTVLFAAALTAFADDKAVPGPLEKELIGHWVLQGTLAGREVIHDVDAQWVLGSEYVQLHEVARGKKTDGTPEYEALIYIEWNDKTHEYSCLWLDSTGGGGLSNGIRGRATPTESSIPFVFAYSPDHMFHNTFTYDRKSDSWEWLLEDHDKGKVSVFGRVRLKKG